jgi:diguanylate cyclase
MWPPGPPMPTTAKPPELGRSPLNDSPHPNANAAAAAERELARLHGQVEAARAVLIRVLQDVVAAEGRMSESQAAVLLEANEALVVSALQARSDAETTVLALDEVSRSAKLDTLTQLPNRLLFDDRLAQAIASAKRHGTQLAVMFLDIDRFKQVNDTLGHAAGDEVLQQVAHRLAGSVRAADTVSRLGGDEFLILLTEVSRASDVSHVADKVKAALRAPSGIGSHALPLTASIGISLYPDDGQDAGTLISLADAAMYRVKRKGRDGFAFHGSPGLVARPPALQRPTVDGAPPAGLAHDPRQTQLREANEQLVLAALDARELQGAAERAQRRQAEFMAVVVDELRNPYAPIRIATAMLGRGATDEPLLPRVRSIVGQQAAQITRLVDGRVDSSKLTAGRLRLDRRAIDMVALVDEVVVAARDAINGRRQHLAVHLPRGPVELQGDHLRLAQVIGNLLDNASRYTPHGGEIELSLTTADDAIVLTVADNGAGITATALPTLFDPFVQDTQAIAFNGIGLGIGLTVVRTLVEAHGGSVVANSAGNGQGSRFVVTLPRHAQPATETAAV